MGDAPNNSTHPDLVSTLAWLERFREAQHDRLTEFEDALRRTDRLIALLDDSAGEENALDDVRLLLARGALNYSLPETQSAEPFAHAVITGWTHAALWAVVTTKWHDGYFSALRTIASMEIAQLASSVHAVLRKSDRQRLAMEMARSLAEERYAAGILNLIDDMRDPQRGGAALLAVTTLRDGKPIEAPRDPNAFLKFLLFVGTAAASGVIGNRADALVQDVLKQLPDAIKQFTTPPAVHSLGPRPLLIELPALNFRMELVRVPAGEFLMGSDKAIDKDAYDSEMPQHWVYLDEYFIGKYPVTVAQFAAFVTASHYRTDAERDNQERTWQHPRGKASDVRDKQLHPVTYVSWQDAKAFCDWLSRQSGYAVSMPTEAEWEKAARWDAAKREARIWSWGNLFDKNKANTHEGGLKDTSPVGSYSGKGGDSPCGCADMAGNVWEWCADWYGSDEYKNRANTLPRNPGGPASGEYRALRGGSYAHFDRFVRCAYRNYNLPFNGDFYLGFRVVVRSHSLVSGR